MTFFIDLWADLRERRLWPVAVGLVAAIAAIPLVLFKPASGAPAPVAPIVSATPQMGSVLPTVSVSTAPTDGSRLETFKQKNPFKPMADLKKAQTTGSPAAATAAKAVPASSGGSTSSASTSSTGGTSPSSGSSGATGTPGSSTPSVTQHTTTTSWTYTATFQFGTPDKMKTKKDVKPFTLLPDENAPVIVFASADADQAVFYIQNQSFLPEGEGKCDKTSGACHFVTLTTNDASNEEAFVSSDGTEYDIKLLSIDRKTVDPSAKGASATPKSGKGKTVSGAASDGLIGETVIPALFGFTSTTSTVTTRK